MYKTNDMLSMLQILKIEMDSIRIFEKGFTKLADTFAFETVRKQLSNLGFKGLLVTFEALVNLYVIKIQMKMTTC